MCQASLAVDTGAAVNVLSEKTFQALKRVSRGGRYQSLRSNRIVIVPDSNTVKFQGRCFKAMDQPVCLASPWKSRETPTMGFESVSHEMKVHTVPTLSAVPVPDTGATETTQTDVPTFVGDGKVSMRQTWGIMKSHK